MFRKNGTIFLSLCIVTLLSCAVFRYGTTEKEPSKISGYSNVRIDSLLRATSARDLTITERINEYSRLFLGTDYSWTCTGDGPYALIEDWPLVNFSETNCMVLCEHTLAMAISDSWDNFFNNLQQIRYRDGIIGMRTRNHYTMADWLPENDWLLADVARAVGGDATRSVARTISHDTFFRNKGIDDLRYVKPDREIAVDYIPLAALTGIEDKLKTGDICAILFADRDDIFSAHMFLIAETNGRKMVREASTSRNTTFETPYAGWAAAKTESDTYIGISVMRVREELNTPGRVIRPWDIPGLKKNVR